MTLGAARTPGETVALVVLENSDTSGVEIIAVDTAILHDPMDENVVLGMISARPSRCYRRGAQLRHQGGIAMEVQASAARPGWGPLLYDALLVYTKRRGWDGVIPDRRGVSPAAEKVWGYFLERREDVASVAAPAACLRHDGRAALDRVYRQVRPFNMRYDELKVRGQRALDAYADAAGVASHIAEMRLTARATLLSNRARGLV